MIRCNACQRPLPAEALHAENWFKCQSCGAVQQIAAFPALYRPLNPAQAAAISPDHRQATCFYHPNKQAVMPCGHCGRFICSLCEVQIGDAHLCPNCLLHGKESRDIETLENSRTLYDNIALALAIWPILFIFVTLLTAPMAIYVALRHWKSPGSMVRGSKLRFSLAILISLAQLTGWAVFFAALA